MHQQIALTADIEGEPSDALAQTYRLLDLFSQFDLVATLFFVGELALRAPELVRESVSRGHEIALHGYRHIFLDAVSGTEFRRELRDHVSALEDIAQHPISGFRAPYFSINQKNCWIFDELIAAGLQYDASVYPGWNDRYGWPNAPRQPVRLNSSDFKIFPVPLLAKGPPIAFSGGAYLRILPRFVVRWGFAWERRPSHPHMIYLHPWELSSEDASFRISGWRDCRQWLTRRPMRGQFASKLTWLLGAERNRLSPMARVLRNLPNLPSWTPSGRRVHAEPALESATVR
jgi:polysaccharide deacetylase family protein (PEP-CTERM system associated)